MSLFIVVVAVAVLSANKVSGQGDATIQQLTNAPGLCPNTSVSFTCQTTVTGVLEWENVDGDTVRFTTSNDPGASGSLGPVSVTLAEENANTLVSRVNVTITNSDVSLVCTNDANSAIAALNLMSRSSDPRNFVCSSTECTWDPPADTPNCCIEYMVVMTNASGTVQVSVGLATVYNRPDVTSDTAIGVFCQDGLGRESARSRQQILTAPIDPSSASPVPTAESSLTTSQMLESTPTQTPTGDPPKNSSNQWYIWFPIGLLFLSLVIYAIVMTALYIYERCKQRDDNNSIKHGVDRELDDKL